MAQPIYNTMRFGTDQFNIIEDADKTALIIAKEPITTDPYTIIKRFIIDYEQPTGTQIAFAFTTDIDGTGIKAGDIFTLINNGSNRIATSKIIDPDSWLGIGPYTTDTITADIVLEQGNSIADLLALNGLELAPVNLEVKQRLRPVIALKADGSNIPKVKMSIEFANPHDILEVDENRTTEHDTPFKILDASCDTSISGDASATVTAAYKTAIDGDYSDFLNLDTFAKTVIDKKLYGIRWNRKLSVGAIKDSNKAKVKYRALATFDVDCKTFGDTADIFTITKNYYLPLKYCVVVVKHAELSGDKIKAFAKIDPNIYWFNRQIGTGNGQSQTISLTANKFVDVSTLKVYVNGVQTFNYSFWADDNTITITAAQGATISASFNYNLKSEEWVELTADPTQHDISDGKFTTRFWSKITDTNAYVSAIRLQLTRAPKSSDTVITLPITPTGEEQTYKFSQSNIELVYFRVLDSAGNILFENNGAYQSLDCECEFNPKTSTLKFTVPAGNYKLEADYRKKTSVPRIYSFTAGWCV